MGNFLSSLFGKRKIYHEYQHTHVQFKLEDDGIIEYAQWLHPGEFGNTITQARVNFFKRYIKKGDFVIDIGAHEGDTTVPMAIAAGTEGTALGIEANPNVFKVLQVNAGLNKTKTNITPLNFAVTAEDGEFVFGSGDPSFGNGGIVGFTHNQKRNVRYTFKVQGKNLEQYLNAGYAAKLASLSFIKIDTEGYDKEIIKSIQGLISKYRPTIVTECFGPATKDEKFELYDLLAGNNYNTFQVDSFDTGVMRKLVRDMMGEKKTFDILAIPAEKK